MQTKFKIGDVVHHKTNLLIKVVIVRVKKSFFGRPQKYKVAWYDTDFHTGTAKEHELTT